MRAGIVVLGFSSSLLAAGALADKAVQGRAAAATAPAPLRLIWIDVHGIVDDVSPAVFAETARLTRESGLPVQWEKSDGSQRISRPGDIHVVLMATPPPSLRPHVMGAAQPAAPEARAVWIYVSAVRRALGLAASSRSVLSPRDRQRLGRAVARIVLHEVVHVAAPRRPHAAEGLMAARLSRTTLEEADLALDADLVQVLRAAAEASETPIVSGTTVAVLAPVIVE